MWVGAYNIGMPMKAFRHSKQIDETDHLIYFIIERISRIGRTRLVKLCFLSDLASRIWLGRPISRLQYYFYKHGPFDKEILDHKDYLKKRNLIGESMESDPSEEFESYCYTIEGTLDLKLSSEECYLAKHVCESYGNLPLASLLDYVYHIPVVGEAMKLAERGIDRPIIQMDLYNNLHSAAYGFNLSSIMNSEQEFSSGNILGINESIPKI